MGIPYFSTLLKLVLSDPSYDNIVRKITLKDLKGKKIVVDTNQVLFRILVRAIKENGGPFINTIDGVKKDIGHLHVMIHKDRSLKVRFGIKPIYVFDGKPHKLKITELLRRSQVRKKASHELKILQAEELLSSLDDGSPIVEDISSKIVSCQSKMVSLGKSHTEDCVTFLKHIGTPVIWANCESDIQCAEIARHKDVYGALSDDSDLLAHGTPILIRKLTNEQYEEIHLFPLIKALGLMFNKDDLTPDELKEIIELNKSATKTEINKHIMSVVQYKSYSRFVNLCVLLNLVKQHHVKEFDIKAIIRMVQNTPSIDTIAQQLLSQKIISIPTDKLVTFIDSYYKYYTGIDSDVVNKEDIDIEQKYPNSYKALHFIHDTCGFGDSMSEVVSSIITNFNSEYGNRFSHKKIPLFHYRTIS